MIRKTSRGFQVFDKSGKRSLSKDNLTEAQAQKRNEQVKHFKKLAGETDGDGKDTEGMKDKD